MVVVKVTDPKNGKVYEFYMDKKLKDRIDVKIKTALNKREEDYILVVDGKERAGKSVFAMQLARYIDPSLSLSRVCFSPNEFKEAIIKAKPKQAVIFDEGYRGLSAKGTLTEINKTLVSLMMEMGQKKLFVIIVLPTFYLLEKYVALWRTRGLFHIFRSKGRKGYWRFYGPKKILKLFLKGKKDYSYRHAKTHFRGRFYNQYAISESEYKKKKAIELKKGYENPKKDKYLEQRDIMVNMVHKELSVSQEDMATHLKLNGIFITRSGIRHILDKFRKK